MAEYEQAERSHASSRCPCHPVQRRSHKKSRNGCRNCKQRRIKCDENKPTCENCSRCYIRCDFSPDNANPSAASAIAPRKRGRPPKRRTANCLPEAELSDPHHPIQSTSSLVEKFRNPHPLNVEDLQLFHHYVSNVSLTLGDDVLWHDKVPLLAFENPFLLNLTLALSALHLARLHVSEATKYMRLAEVHSSVALPCVTEMLSDVNRSNCSALYIATILICGCTLAKTPKSGHLLVVAEGTEVGWLGLIRGVHSIIDIMGLPAIFSGHLGPFPVENLTVMPPTKNDQGYIPWEEPLSNLAVLIVNWEEPEYDFHVIHKALVECFHCVYGTSQKPDSCTHGKIYIVMRWLITLEDGFINQVQLKMPLALLVLAHFAVLLQTVECFWYMGGWAHCLIDGVLEHLDPSYRFWISWPKEKVGCQCNGGLG